jgi:hypothetical protein
MKLISLLLVTCMQLSGDSLVPRNEWRGLVPMKSTRADVERLLGSPYGTPPDRYHLANETVSVEYVSYPCDLKPPGCPTPPKVCELPTGTVLAITVDLKQPVPLSSLQMDLSKFERETGDIDSSGRVLYFKNKAAGFWVHVLEGWIIKYSYHPTREDQKLFRRECAADEPRA